jgi:N-acetylneuraminic acid mutarotase
MLNGSGSSDANGDALTYSWSFISKPGTSTAALTGSTTVNPTFTADKDGSYVIQLIVNDSTVDSAADTVTITAATGNSAPVANAGPDQSVSTGSLVTLHGSGSSDANGDTLTYSWSITSKPGTSTATLSGAATVNPTFTADKDGSYVVQLIVNDGTVNSTADSVTITAATANSAPIANAGPDQNISTGSVVTLNGSGSSDADGNALTYSWSFTSKPATSTAALTGATTAGPTFTADKDGTYVVQLIVNDGKVNSTADTVSITAATVNSAPIANAGANRNVITGKTVLLSGSGSTDANGDPLTYTWSFTSTPATSSATLAGAATVSPTFTADKDGAYVVQLIVNDGKVSGAADTVTITAGSTDYWMATGGTGAPDPRYEHSIVWTGAKMIVWGGYGPYNDGGVYDPATDTWTAMSTTGAPTARAAASAVWTGTKMIVWGGWTNGTNDGAIYDPATNTWAAMTTTGAPDARGSHSAVWTGSKMVVWGGRNPMTGTRLNTGGVYDPATNIWSAMTMTNAPSPRYLHSTVWTGSKMIIWGGNDGVTYFNTGGVYDPVSDTWTATSTGTGCPPAHQRQHSAVWTGTEMIIWGGWIYNNYTNTGNRYDPVNDTWTATSTTGAPQGRFSHSAVWTGSEMIVWGGLGLVGSTGGKYNPATDAWTATSTTGAPTGRYNHSTIWTGTEMIIWGGYTSDGSMTSLGTGGLYAP